MGDACKVPVTALTGERDVEHDDCRTLPYPFWAKVLGMNDVVRFVHRVDRRGESKFRDSVTRSRSNFFKLEGKCCLRKPEQHGDARFGGRRAKGNFPLLNAA